MDTNVYITLCDVVIDDKKYSAGMIVNCYQHGLIKSYNYVDYKDHIPWSMLEEIVDEHLHSRHYS